MTDPIKAAIEALDHARAVADVLQRTDVSDWKSKTDLKICFYEDLQKYEKALTLLRQAQTTHVMVPRKLTQDMWKAFDDKLAEPFMGPHDANNAMLAAATGNEQEKVE